MLCLFDTSKYFRSYLKEEPICRMVCHWYGVQNNSTLDTSSLFTWEEIYTCLLRKYRKLLGLWASDCSYTGGIMEFRAIGDNGSPGIECATWEPKLIGNSKKVVLQRQERFRVSLSRDCNGQCSIQTHWKILEPGGSVPRFHVFPSSRSSIIAHISGDDMWTYGGFRQPQTVGLPDFPSKGAAWYDTQRQLLNRGKTPLPRPITFRHPDEGSYLYKKSLGLNFPPALTIQYPTTTQTGSSPPSLVLLHFRFRDFRQQDLERGVKSLPGRFYPVRTHHPPLPSFINHSIGTAGWDPRCLEGVWIETYKLSYYRPDLETQVMYLEWVTEEREIRAWKLTGNIFAPRGIVGWNFKVGEIRDHHNSGLASYYGKATTYGAGYTKTLMHLTLRKDVRIIVVIRDYDHIEVTWGSVERVVHNVKRYRIGDTLLT
ncbi:hypothetical protein QCA50_003649 [Cerrena zonata]|uniref:Uncharacterized protein n=1 Tax=Cerrena zonata TaxID=2478898 RepID=A0AAW0GL43_9APHY